MRDIRRARSAALRDALVSCLAAMAAGGLAATTTERVAPVVYRFGSYATSLGVQELRHVSAQIAEGFIRSRLETGLVASTATMHDRRSSLRLVFRFARRLRLLDGDPTLDVTIAPRSSRPARPLIEDEVELARDLSLIHI